MNRFVSLVLVMSTAACAQVAGTADLEPCDETCPGGGGAGGGSNTSTGGSTISSSGCFDVTVEVAGNVKIEAEPQHVDFDNESSGPICLAAGTITMSAECDDGGGDDPVVAVDWGNDLCEDGQSSCTFELAAPEIFTVRSDACP
jgi:hypothetical protein